MQVEGMYTSYLIDIIKSLTGQQWVHLYCQIFDFGGSPPFEKGPAYLAYSQMAGSGFRAP